MIVVLPVSLMAQTSGGGMGERGGGVLVNGNTAPNYCGIVPHDLIQTQKEHRAKIDANGSTVTVEPDTIVQFDGEELVLDHGGLQVNTSREMKVRVNCVTVIPVTQVWTRYDVIDVDGKIRVTADENDVKIHYQGASAQRSKTAALSDEIVHQGEQASRDERCGAAAQPAEVINAKGAILNSVWAKGAGLIAIGVVTCLGLCHDDDPISPSKPKP